MKQYGNAFQPTRGTILFLLLCLLLGVSALGWVWGEFIWLRLAGVTTQGEIVARTHSPKGELTLTYQFVAYIPDEAERIVERGRLVRHNFTGSTIPGSPVTIRYLPNRPEISNIEGNRYVLFGDIATVTVVLGLLDGFLALLLFWSVKDWLANRQR